MDRTDEIMHYNLSHEASIYRTETIKCLLNSGVFLSFEVITFAVFYLCNKNKYVKRALELLMNYLRSILAGVIIGLNYLIRYSEIPLHSKLSGLIYYLIHICPSIQLLFCLLLIVICFPIYRMTKKSNLNNDIYHALSLNVDFNTPTNDDVNSDNDSSRTSRSFLRIKSLIDWAPVAKISYFKDFNNNYAPIINLSSILLFAFYSVLGFGGFEVFGWYEVFIFIHKIFEVYCINRSFRKLKMKRNYLLIYLIAFFLLTPFGILLRGYFKINNTFIENIPATILCDNMFYRSIFISIIVGNLAPIPESIFAISVNFLSLVFSSLLSSFLFKRNYAN